MQQYLLVGSKTHDLFYWAVQVQLAAWSDHVACYGRCVPNILGENVRNKGWTCEDTRLTTISAQSG